MTMNSIGAEAARFGRQAQDVRQEAVAPATSAAPDAQQPTPLIVPGSYINPIIRWNREAEVLMVEYRDWQTGEPKRQFPPEWVASKYNQAEVKPTEPVPPLEDAVAAAEAASKQADAPAVAAPVVAAPAVAAPVEPAAPPPPPAPAPVAFGDASKIAVAQPGK